MVNNKSSTQSLGSPGAGTSAASAGAGSNPSSNSAGGGGAAASTSAPGAIPVVGGKVGRGFRAEVTQIASGIGSQFPDPNSPILVKGQSMTRDQLLTALAAVAALYAAVDSTRQQLKSSLLALEAGLPDARELIAAVKVALVGIFGRGNPVLENFGIRPYKARKLTGKKIVAKQAKSSATREKRGTLGARQKADVKFVGQVQVQTNLSGPAASGDTAPTAGTGSSSAGAPAGAAQPTGTSQP